MRNIAACFFPDRCPVCGKPVGRSEGRIHAACAGLLPVLTGDGCIRCGRPLQDERAAVCRICKDTAFAFTAGRSLWVYDPLVRHLLAALKYKGCREYGVFIGEEMAGRYGHLLKTWGIDCILPVPVHPDRLKVRGYNQAAIPARALGESLGLPVMEDVLFRKKKTTAQKELGRRERMQNLADAFGCRAYGENRVVLLTDDIYTTGSTVSACAGVLKRAGFAKVYFLAAACVQDG